MIITFQIIDLSAHKNNKLKKLGEIMNIDITSRGFTQSSELVELINSKLENFKQNENKINYLILKLL